MNEQIIEMAIEAGFNPVNCPGSNVPLFEKFAELIVLKCAEIAETAEPYQSADLIKQYFGNANDI